MKYLPAAVLVAVTLGKKSNPLQSVTGFRPYLTTDLKGLSFSYNIASAGQPENLIRLRRLEKMRSMREKSKPAKKKGRIAIILMAVFTVLVLILNIGVTMLYDVITYYFKGADTDYNSTSAMASRAAAEETVREIVRGGVVLLKNEPDAAGNTLLPLATSDEAKTPVNLFGWDSVGWIAGGSGSGSSSDADFVDLPAAMEAGDYEVNQELIDLYRGYMDARPGAGVGTVDWTILEMPVEQYTDAVMENAKAFSDVAFISIGRMGGEGNDLPTDMSGWGGKAGQHYLELSDTERAMVELVCANFDQVVVLINSASTMELGWVDEFDSIRSVVYVGMTGARGLSALPEILSGAVSPSGRTADLYAYDLTDAPTFVNAGAAAVHTYTNTKTGNVRGGDYASYQYIAYQEGIYTGYRYYETRGVTDGEEWYADHVQYPFGYGLSYTTFEQKLESMTTGPDGSITVEVSVRNTGNVSGRDVVELYYTAPYTEGGMEKSHVVLLDFGKTAVLEPGQEQSLTFTFFPEDMASYDYQGAGCYVLEAGDYEIKLMANSHEVLDSKKYTVSETITFDEEHKRTGDQTAAMNRFDDAAGDVVYLSRADWEGTWPKGTQDAEADAELVKALELATVETYADPTATMPTTGAANNLTLADMTGLPYEDEKWDSLLDQMTVEDMFTLVSKGGYQTEAIASIGKPHANDLDGPQGINESNQSLKAAEAASYPAECLSGCTWDVDVLEKMGQSLGQEALAYNVNGWYAPAVNLHRSPFGGRVFEYYSEDPVLSGRLGSACISGASQHGVYAYVKHFALNETETLREGLVTWCNEQAMRELYLKAFEIPVKEGGATAIMSAFNNIGPTWAGGSHALLTDVLRGEWGFRGSVVTDYYMGDMVTPNMNGYAGLYAGNDLWLAPMAGAAMSLNLDLSSPTVVNQLRNACHNILYVSANSNLVDPSYAANVDLDLTPAAEQSPGVPLWAILFYGVFDGLYVIGMAAMVVWVVRRRKKAQTAENAQGGPAE